MNRHQSITLDQEEELREVRERYASLSRREREVMALVVSGMLNRRAGGELHIGEITVKAHRGKVMRKMKANSLADLVKIAAASARRPHRNRNGNRDAGPAPITRHINAGTST